MTETTVGTGDAHDFGPIEHVDDERDQTFGAV